MIPIRNSMRRQAGNMLVTTMLALVIMGMIALVKIRQEANETKHAAGIGEAKLLSTLAGGVNTLIANEWLDFQNGSTVTYNGASITPTVVSGVTTWSPTIAQLKSMSLPVTGWTATTSSITSGALTVTIMRTPSGCSGTACSIVGYVYANAAYTNGSSVDGPLVGAMLTQLGTDGGVSLPGSPATITGYASSWTYTNPVSGTPAGVVAVQVGLSSAQYAQFVRIGDTRDPSLQGNLTVAGATSLGSTLAVTGATTLNSTLGVAGTTTLSGTTAVGGALKVTGASSMASTLAVSGATTLGSTLAVTGAVTGSTSATFGGMVKGTTFVPSVNVTAGAACAPYTDGTIAVDSTSTGTLLVCRAQSTGVYLWTRPGLPVGAVGGSCTTGALAVTTANLGLICRNSLYVSLTDRVTSLVAMASTSGTGVGTVAAPTCGTGGSAEITVTPQETGTDYGGTPVRNRFALVTTYANSTWTITPSLVDTSGTTYTSDFTGTAYAFTWLATTYCNYGAGA